mmetsp:Transcript_20247/g.49674  ORF Transcript_20247/g.49674 Transcript_20247/m.49674 type:complete len:109 (-) Transcript_20247:172-498(-)
MSTADNVVLSQQVKINRARTNVFDYDQSTTELVFRWAGRCGEGEYGGCIQKSLDMCFEFRKQTLDDSGDLISVFCESGELVGDFNYTLFILWREIEAQSLREVITIVS